MVLVFLQLFLSSMLIPLDKLPTFRRASPAVRVPPQASEKVISSQLACSLPLDLLCLVGPARSSAPANIALRITATHKPSHSIEIKNQLPAWSRVVNWITVNCYWFLSYLHCIFNEMELAYSGVTAYPHLTYANLTIRVLQEINK
jgi:hypothetical protein